MHNTVRILLCLLANFIHCDYSCTYSIVHIFLYSTCSHAHVHIPLHISFTHIVHTLLQTCIRCCTYHVTPVYFHIFLTQGHITAYLVHTTIHYCTLLVHSNHFTLLKPIYITILLYIQASLHLHHYILHILFIHTTVNMYIPHH